MPKSGSRATQEWQRTSFVIIVFVEGFSIKTCILERPRRAKIGHELFKSDPRETQKRPRAAQSDQRAIQEMPKSGQERFKSDPRVANNTF